MSFFLMKDKEYLEKYNEIWEKVSNIIKNKFNSELVYNKKYLKAEKKSYNRKIKIKECTQSIYISVILIDLVYMKDKNYYPQVFQKNINKLLEKKRSYFITGDIEIYSDDSDDFNDSDEKTEIKKIKRLSLSLKETRII